MPEMTDTFYELIHKMITGIMIPVVFYLLGQINDIQKELSVFEIRVAKEASQYVLRDDMVRVETKIDELKTLIIQEIKRNDNGNYR